MRSDASTCAEPPSWPDWFRPLPRIDRPDRVALARRFAQPTPILLGNAITGWPALARWTPAQLSAAFGELEVEALIDLPRARRALPARSGLLPAQDDVRGVRGAHGRHAEHAAVLPSPTPGYPRCSTTAAPTSTSPG